MTDLTCRRCNRNISAKEIEELLEERYDKIIEKKARENNIRKQNRELQKQEA